MSQRKPLFFLLALFVALLTAGPVSAQPKPAPAPAPAPSADEGKKDEARKLFREGVGLVSEQKYAEALERFEKAHGLYQGAEISYNVGFCERALGRYVRARIALGRALDEHARSGGLDAGTLANTKGLIEQIDAIVVVAKVKIVPQEAAFSVDGRPIVAIDASKGLYGAGVAPPGAGAAAPSESFDLVLDPGNHVFLLSRKGFSDAVVNKTLAPSKEPVSLVFELEKLPARISISSSVKDAIVRVGPVDVGAVPVDVYRPAGSYPITVQKEGFVPYEGSVSVKAGEEAKLNAVLKKKSFNVAEKWWFWTSIVAAAGTVGVVTYFVVRPEPDPPPYNGGSTGWVVQSRGIHF